MSVVSLKKNGEGKFVCPECSGVLEYTEGGQIRVVDGSVDYDNVKPRYVCYSCNRFYRELLTSGFYDVFDLPDENRKPAEKRKVLKTGDLAPMQLKRDAEGRCECPRCGDNMRYLEAEAVKIVDGHADMSDTVARFACDGCSSIYRRIATTDYYQWSEK